MATPTSSSTRRKLSSLNELLPLLGAVVQTASRLSSFAEDVRRRSPRHPRREPSAWWSEVAAVKAPGFGDRRRPCLQDIAILTGGQGVSEDSASARERHAQHARVGARRLMIDKETPRSSTAPARRPTSKRAWPIKRRSRNHLGLHREKLKERLAKLAGGVAVTARRATEVEVKERKDRG